MSLAVHPSVHDLEGVGLSSSDVLTPSRPVVARIVDTVSRFPALRTDMVEVIPVAHIFGMEPRRLVEQVASLKRQKSLHKALQIGEINHLLFHQVLEGRIL